jgi:mannose-1-phosphate guanylyltransferase
LIPDLATRQSRNLTGYVLDAFQEKPSPARADELWRQGGGIAWNAGMFMWRRRAIRQAFGQFAPDVLDLVAGGVESGSLDRAYSEIRSISIDYAVMEPAAAAGQVVMGSMDVGWNDLGSWTALLGELGIHGIDATIAPAGEPFEAGEDDLAVWRSASGRLASAGGVDATMIGSTGPVAVLRGARNFKVRIDDLLDRCSKPEAHS